MIQQRGSVKTITDTSSNSAKLPKLLAQFARLGQKDDGHYVTNHEIHSLQASKLRNRKPQTMKPL